MSARQPAVYSNITSCLPQFTVSLATVNREGFQETIREEATTLSLPAHEIAKSIGRSEMNLSAVFHGMRELNFYSECGMMFNAMFRRAEHGRLWSSSHTQQSA